MQLLDSFKDQLPVSDSLPSNEDKHLGNVKEIHKMIVHIIEDLKNQNRLSKNAIWLHLMEM